MISETWTIKGRETSSTQFPAMTAMGLCVRLIRIVGPSFAQLLTTGATSVTELLNQDATILGRAASELFFNMDADGVTALIRDLLVNTSVIHNGSNVELTSDQAINSVYSGDLGSLLLTVKSVIVLNFRNFFDGALPDAIKLAVAKANA